jgi:hypothetical protein
MKKGERKQFCIRGHDTFICGRGKNHTCNKCVNILCQRSYKINWKKRNEAHRKYAEKHQSKLKKYRTTYIITRRNVDIYFKLKTNLRSRLYSAIKRNYKSGSAIKDLGCSIEFLKQYIESKFYGGMAWKNWGLVWQLDHIKELHTFDLTNREQLLRAVHYTNLQPLTIEDHKKKSNKG